MQASQSPVRYLLDRFARPRWGSFALGAGALFLVVFLQRIPALIIGIALDALLHSGESLGLPLVQAALIPTSTTGQTFVIVAIIGGAILAESAFQWYGTLIYDTATLKTLHDIRVSAVTTATALPMGFHDTSDGGHVLSVVNDDVDNLGDLFAGLRDGLGYLGGLLSAFAFMVLLNWQLALILLAVPVALVVTGRIYARLLEPRYNAVRESVGHVNVRIRDTIQGLSTVKAFAGEETEYDRVAQASGNYKDAHWATHRLQIAYDSVSWTLGTVGIWGLFLLGGYWILVGPPLGFTNTLSAGSLLTFLIYAESFLDPTRRLAVNVIDKLENSQASARRVTTLFERDTPDTNHTGAQKAKIEDGAVEFENVTFSYSEDAPRGEPAADHCLAEVSFTAEGGDFVGVVGATGAGKSTLMKLLFGFYDPDQGTIRIDGQDIAEIDPSSLRSHLGYVGQDPFLFPGTVTGNIAFGDDEQDMAAVRNAASAARAHEFIEALPDGYQTDVGERGTSLSGGQRQRLAIARALYSDPEILVLDEATSHVDNETEAEIQRSLHDIAGDRTIFAIAHRLSTVRDADHILVLEDGEIVEQGTHDGLLAQDGTYASLWNIQTGAIAAGEVTYTDSDAAGLTNTEVIR